MSKDRIIKAMLSANVDMTPNGFVADELSPEQFGAMHELFFEKVLDIHQSDISDIQGYGEFDEKCRTEYGTCAEFLTDTFADDREGYWYNWREMFETTVLESAFFEHYFQEMQARISYCEGHRSLVYNNTFFVNMRTDGKTTVGFPDWSRSGVADFLLDFAIMDLNKPYLRIPERLFAYAKQRGIEIPDFQERFLCMGYYKGLDGLRWHASIDDTVSCASMMTSMRELKTRLDALKG